MLFNSFAFIFLFLPITIAGYAIIGSAFGRRAALCFLTVASLFFYAWWNPPYVLLVMLSIAFNYTSGRLLRRFRVSTGRSSRAALVASVGANLALLGYFKYANFFVRTLDQATGAHLSLGTIFLPLAISFFTFTQISYLVDVYRGEPSDYDFIDYCLFVVFFPHLIAGPIVRHHEILPQIRASQGEFDLTRLPAGLTLFAIGLFSKTFLADSVGLYASVFFNSLKPEAGPHLILAWSGTLAYTCQLYFDFSGYSTMALGLGYVFDIKMPFNFNSPYKARSIIDFWRRWHMSLSRFLRDYLYFSLGGNRKGTVRRYVNLFVTMLLGGLWHGAGWTFVIWGGLHGLYLAVNHLWGGATRNRAWASSLAARGIYRVLTFICVCAAWTVFRASTMTGALSVLKGMIGLNGVSLPMRMLGNEWLAKHGGVRFQGIDFPWHGVYWVVACLAIVFFMPNAQQVMRLACPSFERVEGTTPISWRPTTLWALVTGVPMAVAVVAMFGHVSEFLYFQF